MSVKGEHGAAETEQRAGTKVDTVTAKYATKYLKHKDESVSPQKQILNPNHR